MDGPITILAISGRHSFAGVIDHQDRRVLDVLNDASTEYLHLHHVRVSRDNHCDCVANCDTAIVPKATVEFVTLVTKQHEAPLRRSYSLIEKRPYPVFVTIGDYEIRGELMIQGRPDPVRLMSREGPTFFPVTEAKVFSVGSPNCSIPGVVALVNKSRVSLIHIDDASLKPTGHR